MSDWIYVCQRSELTDGEYKLVEIEGCLIAVYNIEGDFYAIEDVCTHDGGELAGGPVCGFEIECVRHGARFDLRSGAATAPPAYEATTVFPVKIEGERVYTREHRFD